MSLSKQCKQVTPFGRWTTLNSRSWPFVSVKLSISAPNRNVGFAPESGRSECAC